MNYVTKTLLLEVRRDKRIRVMHKFVEHVTKKLGVIASLQEIC